MLHSCGDFYNEDYYYKWLQIADRNPHTYIDAFTRNTEIDLKLCPPNLKIRFSVDYPHKVKINPINELYKFIVGSC